MVGRRRDGPQERAEPHLQGRGGDQLRAEQPVAETGHETNGGFENISISNCSIYETRHSGVTLQIVDGGIMDRIAVSNITMQQVNNPIFIRLGNRPRPFEKDGPKPGMGQMRNITISNIEAGGANRLGYAISGLPGIAIENVTLENRLRTCRQCSP